MIKKIATKSQKELLLFSKKNKLKYLNSKPYPHLVFKNFFDKDFLNKVSKEFPDLSKIKTSINYDNKNEVKFANNNKKIFKKNTRLLFQFLNSFIFQNHHRH